MPRIRVQLLTVLLLIVSTVSSAPNNLYDDLKLNASTQNSPPINDNDSPISSDVVGTEHVPSEGPRTLIMYGLLRWLFGIVKAIIKPARNMYIMMTPEISAFRCLSDSREFQNFMGFSGTDFEGYVYETPRMSDRTLSPNIGSSDGQISNYESYSNEVHDSDLQQKIQPIPQHLSENYSLDNPSGDSVGQTLFHRTDEVLKRFPRFIEEIGSLLKEGQAMNCIMPYMRERVTRWLDS